MSWFWWENGCMKPVWHFGNCQGVWSTSSIVSGHVCESIKITSDQPYLYKTHLVNQRVKIRYVVVGTYSALKFDVFGSVPQKCTNDCSKLENNSYNLRCNLHPRNNQVLLVYRLNQWVEVGSTKVNYSEQEQFCFDQLVVAKFSYSKASWSWAHLWASEL